MTLCPKQPAICLAENGLVVLHWVLKDETLFIQTVQTLNTVFNQKDNLKSLMRLQSNKACEIINLAPTLPHIWISCQILEFYLEIFQHYYLGKYSQRWLFYRLKLRFKGFMTLVNLWSGFVLCNKIFDMVPVPSVNG